MAYSQKFHYIYASSWFSTHNSEKIGWILKTLLYNCTTNIYMRKLQHWKFRTCLKIFLWNLWNLHIMYKNALAPKENSKYSTNCRYYMLKRIFNKKNSYQNVLICAKSFIMNLWQSRLEFNFWISKIWTI